MKYLKGCLIGVAIIFVIIGLLMTGLVKFYPEKITGFFNDEDSISVSIDSTGVDEGLVKVQSKLEIPIKIDSAMQVQVRVSGVPIWFILDMSSKETIIGPVEYTFLKKHGSSVDCPDSVGVAASIKVSDIELADIAFEGANIKVSGDPKQKPTLGMDVLEKFGPVIQINYDTKQLVIVR